MRPDPLPPGGREEGVGFWGDPLILDPRYSVCLASKAQAPTYTAAAPVSISLSADRLLALVAGTSGHISFSPTTSPCPAQGKAVLPQGFSPARWPCQFLLFSTLSLFPSPTNCGLPGGKEGRPVLCARCLSSLRPLALLSPVLGTRLQLLGKGERGRVPGEWGPRPLPAPLTAPQADLKCNASPLFPLRGDFSKENTF